MPYFFKSFLVIFGCAGSSLLHWLFSSCGEWGLHSIEMHGLLIAMASPVAKYWLQGTWASAVAFPRLYSTGLVLMAHGHSCSTACGIFLVQGSNLCLLY